MKGKTIFRKSLILSSLVLLCLLVVSTAFGDKEKSEELVLNLWEISVFDIDEQIVGRFVRGHVISCEEQPEADIGTYPASKSDNLLYGSIWFAGEYGIKNSGI